MAKTKPKVEKLMGHSYLALLKNSPGSKMFRNFYALVNGREEDVIEDGKLACAYFVSSVLTLFGFIKRIHLTVTSTLRDLRKSGWQEIKQPQPGAVLLWEEKDGHQHLGFYLGKGKAISHREEEKVPTIHDWTYHGQRKVEAIFWSDKIEGLLQNN